MRQFGSLLVAAALLAACGPEAPTNAAHATPTPATIDVTGWTTSVHGVGPSAAVTGGRLQLTMPWSTHNDQNGNDLSVHEIAPCQLSGDFDLTVHYTLVTWPLNSGVWIGLGAGDYAVARVSHRTGVDNRYATYMAGTVTEIESSDMSGSFRLTRVGATVTGYYKDASGAWTKIATANPPAQTVPYQLEAWTDASFGRRTAVAMFDSLTLTGTKTNCS